MDDDNVSNGDEDKEGIDEIEEVHSASGTNDVVFDDY